MSWKQAIARALGVKGTVVATTNARDGWELYGIPSDAGDGFAYNAEGRLWSDAVCERTMLQLDTVYACVKLLSQTIATLPISMFRRMSDGGRKAVPDHPLYELLHNQPNEDMTAVDFWQVIVAMMLLRGTAFAEVIRLDGRIIAIDPLSRGVVTWTRKNGEYEFAYTLDGKRRVIPRADLWIIPAFTLDGVLGLSPVCYGTNVFGGALSVDRASNQTFANGMAASGFVSYGKDSTAWLKRDQRTQLHESLSSFSRGGARRGGVFVLEGGMGYTALSMNPEDAQMLETRAFNVETICRWFGVPPTLVGHGDKTSNWGTGLEQQNLSFLTYTLRPWLSKIEQAIRKELLSPAEKARYFAEFSVEGLLRADSAGRAEYYSKMVNNGIWVRDEARVKENLQPMGGNAAVLTVQSALVPLDKIGEAAPAPAPVEPPAEPKGVTVNVGKGGLKGYKITRNTDGTAIAVPLEET